MKNWKGTLVTLILVLGVVLILGIDIHLLKKNGYDVFAKIFSREHASMASGTATSTETKKSEIQLDIIPCGHRVINKKIEPVDLSSKLGLITVADEVHYKVQGNTWGQISYQLVKCTPTVDYLGTGVSAITTSQIDWAYDFIPNGTQICNISNIAVGLRIRTLLPTLDTGTSTPSTLIDRWNTFLVHTKKHEDGHTAIATKYADNIYSYLTDQSNTHTCLSSHQYLEDKLQNISSLVNSGNWQYDTDTHYGQTQGAVF